MTDPTFNTPAEKLVWRLLAKPRRTIELELAYSGSPQHIKDARLALAARGLIQSEKQGVYVFWSRACQTK